jgi:hypothetical protein
MIMMLMKRGMRMTKMITEMSKISRLMGVLRTLWLTHHKKKMRCLSVSFRKRTLRVHALVKASNHLRITMLKLRLLKKF